MTASRHDERTTRRRLAVGRACALTLILAGTLNKLGILNDTGLIIGGITAFTAFAVPNTWQPLPRTARQHALHLTETRRQHQHNRAA